eukprot:4884761-Prymnesium_polylepis.2
MPRSSSTLSVSRSMPPPTRDAKGRRRESKPDPLPNASRSGACHLRQHPVHGCRCVDGPENRQEGGADADVRLPLRDDAAVGADPGRVVRAPPHRWRGAARLVARHGQHRASGHPGRRVRLRRAPRGHPPRGHHGHARCQHLPAE